MCIYFYRTRYKIFRETLRALIKKSNNNNDKIVLLVDMDCVAGFVNSCSPLYKNTLYNSKIPPKNCKINYLDGYWGLWTIHDIQPNTELFYDYHDSQISNQEADDAHEALEDPILTQYTDSDDEPCSQELAS